MERLFTLSNKRLNNLKSNFSRYLLPEIDWSDRLIAIPGSRGAGKTTMMLQHLKENYAYSEEGIYMSLDNSYFTNNSLLDTIDKFVKYGGKAAYLDEVHKYPNW